VSAERRRLARVLLLSLLVHALLLSLTFGGQEFGLPGLAFPWQERRIEAPDLRVVLLPAPAARHAAIEPPLAAGPSLTALAAAASPAGQAAAVIAPQAEPSTPGRPAAQARPEPGAVTDAAAGTWPSRGETARDAPPAPIPEQAVVAMERFDEPALILPAAASAPGQVIAAAPGASVPKPETPPSPDARDAARQEARRLEAERQEVTRREAEQVETARLEAERQRAMQQAAALQEAARQEAARREAERLENARLEAERREALRLAAARREAERVEVARLDAERREAAQQVAARQEAARQEAERIETARLEVERQKVSQQAAARQEAARQEAARQETARREAEKVENARREAERQEAARQELARQQAARVDAAREQEARREAALRAIGRQLDLEAARREAASNATDPPSRLPPSTSGLRRGRLFGRTDTNAELILYAEAWARKIQLNMTFEMVREAVKRPHTDPLVTVAIRSDGSVESVSFVLSSGVAEIDEAIRRVVQSQLPYPAFPPTLAREYDVIEFRRTWHFDSAIRLY
jgi:hypothetical protein